MKSYQEGYNRGSIPSTEPQHDWYQAVAEGEIPGHRMLHKFGHGTMTTTECSVWEDGTLYPWQTTATTMTATSDDAGDTLLGIGAKQITISGLDANYIEVQETVDMNGLGGATTTQSFIRVNRAWVEGNQEALGYIIIANGGTTYAIVNAGHGQTLMAVYTIPAGYTAYVLKGKASVGQGKEVTVDFYVRPFGNVFRVQHHFHLYENNYEYAFLARVPIPEKSDLDVRGAAATGTVDIGAAFDLLLVEN